MVQCFLCFSFLLLLGQFVSSLDKVVYLENRRYLSEDHPLRKQKRSFPDFKPEKRSASEEANISDILWNSVAHNRAKNKAQASNVAKATGSRGVNCFMLLPNYDRPNQAFPDLMHDLKNIVCTFFDLITGKGDSIKVRKAEKELGRFQGCWLQEKQVDEPEAAGKATQSRFLHFIPVATLILPPHYYNLYFFKQANLGLIKSLICCFCFTVTCTCTSQNCGRPVV